ncbi:uncharacterized protein LOC142606215 [Castanea sativa]|uniref:uncharacterized protein LOC142606215 n=1 Tax=Castanea sativa TaxID=21020 RepID=UPI003F65283F
MQNQNSLFFKCFKARYFPRCQFLDAAVSPNCSYVWRSIVAAIPILRSGSCWRVGNGESIKVFVDKWIPNYPSNRLLHPVHEGEEDWRVSDLIDLDLHGWRRDAIMATFNREDAEVICKIPLSHRRVADVVVWLHNKEGAYTVKSRYHVARKVLREWAESSTGAGQQLWKKLWKIRVPNKMKRAPETVIHAIWECPAAQDVWAAGMEIFVVQAWTVWNQRNSMVHGRQMKHPCWLNKRAADYMEEYRIAQEQLVVLNTISSGHHWQPPPQNMYKLNFDAAVFMEQQCSGVGAIIRNAQGEVMAGMSAKGSYVRDSEEAQALACRQAVVFTFYHGSWIFRACS